MSLICISETFVKQIDVAFGMEGELDDVYIMFCTLQIRTGIDFVVNHIASSHTQFFCAVPQKLAQARRRE
jgi:hypothetical protein